MRQKFGVVIAVALCIATAAAFFGGSGSVAQADDPPKPPYVKNNLGQLSKDEVLKQFGKGNIKDAEKLNYEKVAVLGSRKLSHDDNTYLRLLYPQVVDSGSFNFIMFYEKANAERGLVECNLLNIKEEAAYLVIFRATNNTEKVQKFEVSDSLTAIKQTFETTDVGWHLFSVVFEAKKDGNYRPALKATTKGQWGVESCEIYRLKK